MKYFSVSQFCVPRKYVFRGAKPGLKLVISVVEDYALTWSLVNLFTLNGVARGVLASRATTYSPTSKVNGGIRSRIFFWNSLFFRASFYFSNNEVLSVRNLSHFKETTSVRSTYYDTRINSLDVYWLYMHFTNSLFKTRNLGAAMNAVASPLLFATWFYATNRFGGLLSHTNTLTSLYWVSGFISVLSLTAPLSVQSRLEAGYPFFIVAQFPRVHQKYLSNLYDWVFGWKWAVSIFDVDNKLNEIRYSFFESRRTKQYLNFSKTQFSICKRLGARTKKEETSCMRIFSKLGRTVILREEEVYFELYTYLMLFEEYEEPTPYEDPFLEERISWVYSLKFSSWVDFTGWGSALRRFFSFTWIRLTSFRFLGVRTDALVLLKRISGSVLLRGTDTKTSDVDREFFIFFNYNNIFRPTILLKSVLYRIGRMFYGWAVALLIVIHIAFQKLCNFRVRQLWLAYPLFFIYLYTIEKLVSYFLREILFKIRSFWVVFVYKTLFCAGVLEILTRIKINIYKFCWWLVKFVYAGWFVIGFFVIVLGLYSGLLIYLSQVLIAWALFEFFISRLVEFVVRRSESLRGVGFLATFLNMTNFFYLNLHYSIFTFFLIRCVPVITFMRFVGISRRLNFRVGALLNFIETKTIRFVPYVYTFLLKYFSIFFYFYGQFTVMAVSLRLGLLRLGSTIPSRALLWATILLILWGFGGLGWWLNSQIARLSPIFLKIMYLANVQQDVLGWSACLGVFKKEFSFKNFLNSLTTVLKEMFFSLGLLSDHTFSKNVKLWFSHDWGVEGRLVGLTTRYRLWLTAKFIEGLSAVLISRGVLRAPALKSLFLIIRLIVIFSFSCVQVVWCLCYHFTMLVWRFLYSSFVLFFGYFTVFALLELVITGFTITGYIAVKLFSLYFLFFLVRLYPSFKTFCEKVKKRVGGVVSKKKDMIF